jgi:hypothetical protein
VSPCLQGLAAIVVSPACSLASTPNAGRRSPATPTTAQKATPFRVSGGSEAGSPASAVDATAVERLAACIAEPVAAEVAVAAAPACIPDPPQASSAVEPAQPEVLGGDSKGADVAAEAATPARKPAEAEPKEHVAAGSCSRPPVRASTPARLAESYASPVAGSAVRRMSPAALRSAVKAAPSPLRRAALDSDTESDSCSDSSDDEVGQG